MNINDLLNSDFAQALNEFRDTRDDRNVAEYLKEYNGERLRRTGSVGFREPKKINIYSETEVDDDGNPKCIGDKTIQVAKFKTNYPKKIVMTAVAFLFGKKMLLKAKDSNDGFQTFQDIFIEKMKMHSILSTFAEYVLSETKAAMVFFPVKKLDEDGKNVVVQKVKILHAPKSDNVICEFYPHFNEDEDMDAFYYRYSTIVNNTTEEHVIVWTAEKIYKAVKNVGNWEIKITDNLYRKIPVVYGEVDSPDWEDEGENIDKYEMRVSRLIDTNDYFADPIMKNFGAANLPSKETVGKELNFPINVDPDSGTTYHGDAEYLVWQQSIDSVREELQRLKSEIESGTSTPDLSFENLQKMGNLSGVSRRFMLVEAQIKASKNMRVFGPAVQRAIAIVKAGFINITNIKDAGHLRNNPIKATFDSILPEDLQEQLGALETALQFNSLETIIKNSPYTDDVQEELQRKKDDEKEQAQNRMMPGMTYPE